MGCFKAWCTRCNAETMHCDGTCRCGQLEEDSLIDLADEKDTYREEVAR